MFRIASAGLECAHLPHRVEFEQPEEELACRPQSSLHGRLGTTAIPSRSACERRYRWLALPRPVHRRWRCCGGERARKAPRNTPASADSFGSPFGPQVAERLCGINLDRRSAWSARTRLAIRMPTFRLSD